MCRTFLPAGQLIHDAKGRNSINDHIYQSRNTEPDRRRVFWLTLHGLGIGEGSRRPQCRIIGHRAFMWTDELWKRSGSEHYPAGICTGLTLTSAKLLHAVRPLIQRDYSDGGFYNYIYRGGTPPQ